MTSEPFDGVLDILSIPRFERYLKAAGGERTRAIKLYQWNLGVLPLAPLGGAGWAQRDASSAPPSL